MRVKKGRDGNDLSHRNLCFESRSAGGAPELLVCLMTLPACIIGGLDVSNVTMRAAWRPLTVRFPIEERWLTVRE